MPIKNAHAYRFRDLVALAIPGAGDTVYLTPKEARQFARGLVAAAKSIESVRFVDSNVPRCEITLPDDCTIAGRDYQHARKGA